MFDSAFTNIIAKVLILVNEILDQFVTGVTYTEGNILNCTPATFSGGSLTACGDALVLQIPLLASQGVGLLNGLLVALGI